MTLLRAGGLFALLLAAAIAATALPARAQTAPYAPGDSAGIAKARADSLRYPYTAGDVQFMSHMIAHHAQALVMAGWAPSHGANPEVQRLASRIINAQTDEIAIMQQWLRDRRQPVPDPKAGPMMMTMDGMQHEMLMPGMLTADQMKELDLARGKDFDRLFLRDMIQHHRGAVSMVSDLFGMTGAAQDETVFKFANDVQVDQSTEINRMEKMLAFLTLGITAP